MITPKSKLLVISIVIIVVGSAVLLLTTQRLKKPEETEERAMALKFKAIADTGVSSYEEERYYNYGRSTTIRVKGFQGYMLLKFDLSEIKGKKVKKAELHLCLARGKLLDVGISTIPTDWYEGSGTGTPARTGEPCFEYAAYMQEYWTFPGSDFYCAIFGHGNTLFTVVPKDEVREYNKGGYKWVAIPIPPKIVEALALEDQYGIVIADDKGERWVNIDVYTKEAGWDLSPYLLVWTEEPKGKTPPGEIKDFKASTDGLWNGQIMLSWIAPSPGDNQVLGYEIWYSDQELTEENFKRVGRMLPRYMIPRPGKPGERQTLLISGLKPGTTYYFAIRAYDELGNYSKVAITHVKLPERKMPPSLPEISLWEPEKASSIPEYEGKIRVWALNDIEKVSPITGARLESGRYETGGDDDYKLGNFVWDAKNRTIMLFGSKNEVIAFQLMIERLIDKLSNVRVTVGDLIGPEGFRIKSNPYIEVFREWYVRKGDLWLPDPLLPLVDRKPFKATFNIPAEDNGVPDQKVQGIWVDIYIPREARPGVYKGNLTITADELEKPIVLNIRLEVLPLIIPDRISFDIELNNYNNIASMHKVDRASEFNRYLEIELRYHQLAHKHRQTLNILPYSQSGGIYYNYVPKIERSDNKVKIVDWSSWDKEFGRYLDGSAFTREMGYYGPGEGVPVAHFYLPFHENWPMPIEEYYKLAGYFAGCKDDKEFMERMVKFAEEMPPIEKAFKAGYAEGIVEIVTEYAKHFAEKGWTSTGFQFYLNNKWYWKRPSHGGRGTSYWLFDEPHFLDDFLALRWFHTLFREGVERSGATNVNFVYRVDISRPQLDRGLIANLTTLWVTAYGAFEKYHELCMEYKRMYNITFWAYSTGPDVDQSNLGIMAYVYRVWLLGADGCLVYWTSFPSNPTKCWKEADRLAIVYPGTYFGYDGPLPSMRLKVQRRAQQDIEYLNMLAKVANWNRDLVTRALAVFLAPQGQEQDYADNPYLANFTPLGYDDYLRIRMTIMEALLRATKG